MSLASLAWPVREGGPGCAFFPSLFANPETHSVPRVPKQFSRAGRFSLVLPLAAEFLSCTPQGQLHGHLGLGGTRDGATPLLPSPQHVNQIKSNEQKLFSLHLQVLVFVYFVLNSHHNSHQT